MAMSQCMSSLQIRPSDMSKDNSKMRKKYAQHWHVQVFCVLYGRFMDYMSATCSFFCQLELDHVVF